MANKTNAASYPVTTPYGWVKGYPIHTNKYDPIIPVSQRSKWKKGYGFHTGIDLDAPMSSDLIINGIKIADTGNTGYTTGPHLHFGKRNQLGQLSDPYKILIDKKFVMGRGPLGRAKIISKGYDKTNGHFIRVRTGWGAIYIFCHLKSTDLAVVGKKL